MSSIGPFFNFNNTRRADLFDAEDLKNLNTYRNWGTFTAPIQKMEVSVNPEEDVALPNTSIKSLFNPVYSVGYNQFMQVRQNAPLLDSPEMRATARRGKDCSIKALVEASQNNMLGRAVYSYADFMYCKHLGKVPNNYLITLRRFPFPAGDHINYTNPFVHNDSTYKETEKHNPDVGRLVTWLGTPGNDMSGILKWDVKMPFEEKSGSMEQGGGGGGDNGGPIGTFLNVMGNNKYRDQMVRGYAGRAPVQYMNMMKGPVGWASKGIGKFASAMGTSTDPPYTGGHMDGNKVYGPLDVINKTHIRSVGLDFNHEINLTFDYELRSYDGINPKMAFLDLLGNILAVTYANGAFWGGAYHGSGPSQSNVFANLPIYKLNGNSSFSDVVGAFVESGQTIFKTAGGGSGNFLTDLKNIAATLAKGIFSALLGAGLNALGRPQKNAVNSLLSPAPVGFWHLTVGNPWNPIMSIGNLILDGATVEQYGPLGLDDFPTGIRVTCKLKHGKSRDSTQIEHMFMQGDDRIYTPVDREVLEMYRAADPVNSQKMQQEKAIELEKQERERNLKNILPPVKAELCQKDPSDATSYYTYTQTKLGITSSETPTPYLNTETVAKAKKDTELAGELKRVTKYFYQWFGTNDTDVISTIAAEAAYGSKMSGKDVTGSTNNKPKASAVKNTGNNSKAGTKSKGGTKSK